MPALQNVVLTDRATTPVAHTFTPRDIRNGIAIVANSSGVIEADEILTISRRQQAGKLRSRMQITVPVVQTEVINGISKPKVIRVGVADVTFTFSTSSTEQERNNLEGMVADALGTGKVLVYDTIVKGQGVYGA